MHDVGVRQRQPFAKLSQACEPLEARQLLSASGALMRFDRVGVEGPSFDVAVRVSSKSADALSNSVWSGAMGPVQATVLVVGEWSEAGCLLPAFPTLQPAQPRWSPIAGEVPFRPDGLRPLFSSRPGITVGPSLSTSAFAPFSKWSVPDSDAPKEPITESESDLPSFPVKTASDGKPADKGWEPGSQFHGNFGHGVISLATLTACGGVQIIQTIDADHDGLSPGIGLFQPADFSSSLTKSPADTLIDNWVMMENLVVSSDGEKMGVIVLSGNLRDLAGHRADGPPTWTGEASLPAEAIVNAGSSAGPRMIQLSRRDDAPPMPSQTLSPHNLPPGVMVLNSASAANQARSSEPALRRPAATQVMEGNARETITASKSVTGLANSSDPRSARPPHTFLSDASPVEPSAGVPSAPSVAVAVARFVASGAGTRIFVAGVKAIDLFRNSAVPDPGTAASDVDPQTEADAGSLLPFTRLGLAPWRTGHVQDQAVDAVWRTIATISLGLAIGGYWYCSVVAARRAELERATAAAPAGRAKRVTVRREPHNPATPFQWVRRIDCRE